jgi:hypothetical protein
VRVIDPLHVEQHVLALAAQQVVGEQLSGIRMRRVRRHAYVPVDQQRRDRWQDVAGRSGGSRGAATLRSVITFD